MRRSIILRPLRSCSSFCLQNQALIDHDAIRPVATSRKPKRRSKYSRRYPSRFWLNSGWGDWLQNKSGSRSMSRCKRNFATISGGARFHCGMAGVPKGRSLGKGNFVCMNAFIVRSAVAIRNRWHRNFQSESHRHPEEAASRNGNLSCSFSVARCWEAAAPMIRPTTTPSTVITVMAREADASKPRPSIVRVIRVRRRRWVGRVGKYAT
ncbi:MAG: hypothetical protein QOF24_3048 [Verrucomicrobiota bacterium]